MKFKKIPGSEFSQRVEPDKKKYAKYYQAMKKHRRLEKNGKRKINAIFTDSLKSEAVCGHETGKYHPKLLQKLGGKLGGNSEADCRGYIHFHRGNVQ